MPGRGLVVRHHVHVDLPGLLDDRCPDPLVEDPGPPRPPGRPDDELGGVDLAGEFEQRGRDVVADHAVQARADARGEPAHLPHLGGGHPFDAVAADHVHHHQFRARLAGDTARAPYEGFGFGTPGYGDDDAFACFPRVGDLVLGAVLGEGGVHLVRDPQQREFAQRREVSAPKVVAERRIDLLGGVHVSVREPASQRFRGDVDELHLRCGPHHSVRHRLLLSHTGDLLDHVVETFEVLDVEGREYVDPGVEQLVDVLPALLVPAARGVRVGEFVDEHHRRPPRQHGLDVEFGHRRAAVLDELRWNQLESGGLLGGAGAAVGLHHGRDHVTTTFEAPVRLPEHRVRLADARRRTEIDPQLTTARRAVLLGTAHNAIIHPRGPHCIRVRSVRARR